MRRLYTILFYVFLPFIFLRLLFKSKHLTAYRHHLKERFGGKPACYDTVDVWVHAVSLGEVTAAVPLIEALLKKGQRILITTMTPTGRNKIQATFKDRVYFQYLPYDFPFALKRFYRRYKMRLGVIMETELWPNLYYYAERSKIPLILLNGRISDKAFKQYQRFKLFFRFVLSFPTAIYTQSEKDSHHFLALDAAPSKVKNIGNIKFDIKVYPEQYQNWSHYKEGWGQDRPVWIAASTHDNEEVQLLNAFKQIKETIPNILLLIAPRHPERFDGVYELCQTHAYSTARVTKKESINPSVDIVVIDTLGELLAFYSLSDFAFVGGSLVPIGGHNVLEAIALQKPVFVGPYMQNSKEIVDRLKEVGGIMQIKDAEELAQVLIQFYQNKVLLETQIQQADLVFKANEGVLSRCIDAVDAAL